jgi:hypothetical protein
MAYKDKSDEHIKAWASRIFRHIAEKNRKKYNIYQNDFDSKYIKELYNNQNKKCYWFDIEITPSKIPRHPFKPSIDRLDNNKGYTKDNIVLCSLMANFARNSLQEEEWIDVVKKFKKELLQKYMDESFRENYYTNKFDIDFYM